MWNIKTLLVLTIVSLASTIAAQPRSTLQNPAVENSAPSFTKDNVWHKNMELIKPVNGSIAEENFATIMIGTDNYVVTPIAATFNSTTHAVVTPSYLRLTKVTDPRAPEHSVFISVKNAYAEVTGLNPDGYIHFGHTEMWHDPISGRVFAAAKVSVLDKAETFGANRFFPQIIASPATHVSILIFDLGEALDFVTTTNKHIEIPNLELRNST